MDWIDIACIVFVCTTANHLGLVSAIERVVKVKLWVVDCPKCLTFWVTVGYCCDNIATYRLETVGYGCYNIATYRTAITVLAISFLASYAAIWLELIEGFIDSLYMKCYEKIYSEPADGTVAADPDEGDSAGTMPEL